MTQSFLTASLNMEENKHLMLIQYICFLSGHEVMIKKKKLIKGKKEVSLQKHLDFL